MNIFQSIQDILTNPLWGLAWKLLWFSVAVLWLSLVFWTLKDARKRIDDGLIVGVAVATSLVFPFIGTAVYAILRPAEYLADVRERELEMLAMEKEIQQVQECPNCREQIRDDFLVCPRCRRPIRSSCPECGKPVEQSWKACPYCGGDMVSQPARESSPSEVVTEAVQES